MFFAVGLDCVISDSDNIVDSEALSMVEIGAFVEAPAISFPHTSLNIVKKSSVERTSDGFFGERTCVGDTLSLPGPALGLPLLLLPLVNEGEVAQPLPSESASFLM